MIGIEENIVEIAWTYYDEQPDDEIDSMYVKECIVSWAHEFEDKYKDVDWNESEMDYYTTIEKFTEDKIREEMR